MKDANATKALIIATLSFIAGLGFGALMSLFAYRYAPGLCRLFTILSVDLLAY